MTLADLKSITTENWHDIDKSTKAWFAFRFIKEDSALWLEWFSGPKLETKVPAEVAILFEVTRGAMICGWFFYPLLTLGVEQCYRLLDTGTRLRRKQLDIPTVAEKKNANKGNTSFKENAAALIKHGLISKADEVRWEAARNLRNWSSHPERQSLYDPGQAHKTLELVAERLNDLFR